MPPKRKEPENGLVPMSFTREGRVINYTITQKNFDDIQNIKANAPRINKETVAMCAEMTKEFKAMGIPAEVTTRPFRKVSENFGHELMNPRNYLTNETVEVNIGGKVSLFYWGRYESLSDAKNKIIDFIKNGKEEKSGEKPQETVSQTIRAKRVPPGSKTDTNTKAETGAVGGSGETDIATIGTQFRFRKFQGNT